MEPPELHLRSISFCFSCDFAADSNTRLVKGHGTLDGGGPFETRRMWRSRRIAFLPSNGWICRILIPNQRASGPAGFSAVGGSQKIEEFVHANVAESSSSRVLCLTLRHPRRIARAGCRRCFNYYGAARAAGL